MQKLFSFRSFSLITVLLLSLIMGACSKDSPDEQQTVPNNTSKTEAKAEDTSEQSEEQDAASLVPETDIYLSRMLFKSGSLSISEPDNITDRAGYDNQPYFMPDNNTILFSSRHGLDQTDLFAYRLSSEKITRLTNTPESEYSPTLTPNQKNVSTVRVEVDGTQRLWEFPVGAALGGIVASNEVFEVVFPEVSGVGYHGWYDDDNAYLFIVAEGGEADHSLVSAARTRAGSLELTRFIGRSIKRIPEQNTMSYIAKDNDDAWYVVGLDVSNGQSQVLAETVKASEDLVWLDATNLLMAKDNKIYHNDLSNTTAGWKSVSSGSLSEIDGQITRLAISPNKEWLAFVVTKNAE